MNTQLKNHFLNFTLTFFILKSKEGFLTVHKLTQQA